MDIEKTPFFTTDWDKISTTTHQGTEGFATWRTINVGEIRIRKVEYSPGYVADHWCNRGHILLVLDGELTTELEDGRKFILKAGMSYQVSTNAEPHCSSTSVGTTLFIVD
jgi:quercetin dioxygenase-like cupin family protein